MRLLQVTGAAPYAVLWRLCCVRACIIGFLEGYLTPC